MSGPPVLHPPSTTVLIVDDQKIMRTALRIYVNMDPGLRVVGDASDGASGLRQARALRPAVVLMDLQMPIMDGIEATRALVEELPETKVLAVTAFQTSEFVVPALRAGASGYLTKDAEPEVITEAIHKVIHGESVVSAEAARVLIDTVRAEEPASVPDSGAAAVFDRLSAREREVLDLLCEGLSNRQIAARIFLTETTVKTHLSNIMDKCGLRDRLQIVIAAYRGGIVRPVSSRRER